MPTQKYYSAPEAIERLAKIGIAESTFYRWVREGVIPKEVPPGRVRGALYPVHAIEEVVAQRVIDTVEDDKQTEIEIAATTDWLEDSDVPYVMGLEWESYGPEYTVNVMQSRRWWMKNPHMCRILFDVQDRRHIYGVFSILPMSEATILKIMRKEMTDHDITADDIQTYEEGGKYYGYVGSIIIRPEYRNYFRQLLNSMLDFFCEQFPHIQLEKLYAYGDDEQGLGLIKHLFFSARYDLSDNAWELDLTKPNPSKLLQGFQNCLKEKREMKFDSHLDIHQQKL